MGIDISKISTKKKESPYFASLSINSLKFDFGGLKKLGAKHKEAFYKDFSALLNAGVDFKTALNILANQQKRKDIKQLFLDLKEEVINGSSFHEAMKKSGRFSQYEFYSVRIGEETKKLDLVFLELYKYFKRQIKLRKQIISVITYPAFVLILTFGVLYFMLTYVVPMFKSVFTQFGADLPTLTKSIIVLSNKFPEIILTTILLFASLTLLSKIYKHNRTYKSIMSNALLRIPYFGKLVRQVYLARFCQFLDLLLTSKTPLTESLEMVQKMIGFYPIEITIDPIRYDIIKGASFSSAMQKHSIYEYKLVSMIAVAEEINELDAMFSKLADEYDEEVEHRSKMIGVVMEPVIIIFIGLIVGIIMIAMYAPMFDLSKIIKVS